MPPERPPERSPDRRPPIETYRELETLVKDEARLKEKVDRLTAGDLEQLLAKDAVESVRAVSHAVWVTLASRVEALKKSGGIPADKYEAMRDGLELLHERIDDDLAQKLLEALADNQAVPPEIREAAEHVLALSLLSGGLLEAHGAERDRAGIVEKTDIASLPAILDREDVWRLKVTDLIAKGLSGDKAWSDFFTKASPHTSDHEKALHFIALVCQKHEEILKKRFDGANGRKRFNDLELGDVIAYLEDVFASVGRFALTLKDRSVDDLAMGEFMDEVVPEDTEDVMKGRFKLMNEWLGSDLHPDLKREGMSEKFASFCTHFGSFSLSSSLNVANFRDAERLYGKEDAARFVDALNKLYRKMQEWNEYFLLYAHGREDFQEELRRYLDKSLMVKDAIQLYGYMHRIRDRDGKLPKSLKESDAVGAFLIQMKVAQMVSRGSEYWGTRMKTFLLRRGGESLLGSAAEFDLPPGARQFLGQVVDVAGREVPRRGWRGISRLLDRTVAIVQELPWWAQALAALGAGGGARFAQLNLRTMLLKRPYLRKIAEMSPAHIVKTYNVDLETAKDMQVRATGALTGFNNRNWFMRQLFGGHGLLKQAKADIQGMIREMQGGSGGDIVVEPGRAEPGTVIPESELAPPKTDLGKLQRTAIRLGFTDIRGKSEVELKEEIARRRKVRGGRRGG